MALIVWFVAFVIISVLLFPESTLKEILEIFTIGFVVSNVYVWVISLPKFPAISSTLIFIELAPSFSVVSHEIFLPLAVIESVISIQLFPLSTEP